MAFSAKSSRPAKGIRRTGTGWQAYLRVRGRFLSKSFPPNTDLDEMREWRERARARAKFGVGKPDEIGGSTFSQDAKEYLALAANMPSFQDREYHINRWIDAFGHRVRATITARDIGRVLEQWRLNGHFRGKKGLSAGALNRRRTALMAMYTTLDGRSARNVVKDVAPYNEQGSAIIRAQPMLVIARVLRQLEVGSKTRARLRVMQWTGWPHTLLAQIAPADVDFERAVVRVPPRKKGAGMRAATVPILPRAAAALRQLFKRKATGEFSASSMHSAFARAWQKENARRAKAKLELLLPIRPYDVRHSFGSWAAGVLKDDRALKELMRTNSIARYTEAATDARLVAARDLLAESRATFTQPKTGSRRAS